MKMTRQRKVILESIEGLTCHPTADQVYQLVRKKLPRISLGTVYRNLESLSSAGLVRKLEPCSYQKRFDPNVQHHLHILCSSCGRLDDFPVEIKIDLKKLVKSKSDFDITGYQIEFTGICPDCLKKRAKNPVRNR